MELNIEEGTESVTLNLPKAAPARPTVRDVLALIPDEVTLRVCGADTLGPDSYLHGDVWDIDADTGPGLEAHVDGSSVVDGAALLDSPVHKIMHSEPVAQLCSGSCLCASGTARTVVVVERGRG